MTILPPFRYQSDEEDSGRWAGFESRPGDIVISTRSKTGTTWVQQICALLIFQTPELPAPLGQLSPWLDHTITPRAEVFARLAAQDHRRFIKTHTPLDGVPIAQEVTYLVTARHPLDMAVSLYHQGNNINRARVRELSGLPEPAEPPAPRPSLRDYLLAWIDREADPRTALDSLPGLMWHLSDAWARRDEPNIALVHYDDLLADLDGQMRRLAKLLGIGVPVPTWPELVQAATFAEMRAAAAAKVSVGGILKDPAAFFRHGTSGDGRAELSQAEVDRYHQRAAQLAPADLLSWLHREN